MIVNKNKVSLVGLGVGFDIVGSWGFCWVVSPLLVGLLFLGRGLGLLEVKTVQHLAVAVPVVTALVLSRVAVEFWVVERIDIEVYFGGWHWAESVVLHVVLRRLKEEFVYPLDRTVVFILAHLLLCPLCGVILALGRRGGWSKLTVLELVASLLLLDGLVWIMLRVDLHFVLYRSWVLIIEGTVDQVLVLTLLNLLKTVLSGVVWMFLCDLCNCILFCLSVLWLFRTEAFHFHGINVPDISLFP